MFRPITVIVINTKNGRVKASSMEHIEEFVLIYFNALWTVAVWESAICLGSASRQ